MLKSTDYCQRGPTFNSQLKSTVTSRGFDVLGLAATSTHIIHLHIDPYTEIQFKIVNLKIFKKKKKPKTFRVGELSLRLA